MSAANLDAIPESTADLGIPRLWTSGEPQTTSLLRRRTSTFSEWGSLDAFFWMACAIATGSSLLMPRRSSAVRYLVEHRAAVPRLKGNVVVAYPLFAFMNRCWWGAMPVTCVSRSVCCSS